MSIQIKPSGQACGAEIRGVDLTQRLSSEEIHLIKQAWSEYHVLSFPDQEISDNELETFTQYFGRLDDEPFFKPIENRRFIAAIARHAYEKTSIFAEAWHTDWSFKEQPPIGTCLFGITIPPQGGETLYANQHLAYEKMPNSLKEKIKDLIAVHSAGAAYSPEGLYGKEDPSLQRAMQPIISEEARANQSHPLVQVHPENGKKAIYGCLGYTNGIDGMSEEESFDLLAELHQWQTKPENIYTHQWSKNMLVMWDNRSVLHRATGGYEGYERLLHRTTIWP